MMDDDDDCYRYDDDDDCYRYDDDDDYYDDDDDEDDEDEFYDSDVERFRTTDDDDEDAGGEEANYLFANHFASIEANGGSSSGGRRAFRGIGGFFGCAESSRSRRSSNLLLVCE